MGDEEQLLASRLASARRGSLTIEDALNITRQVMDALEETYRRITPRAFGCLSPERIVCLSNNTVRLLSQDTLKHPKNGETHEITIDGERGYAAPEQYDSDTNIDVRADIYSLGVLLLQMLTGYDPATATPPFPVPTPHSLSPSMPQGLVDTITRATQIRPELRYDSIAEMRQALFASQPTATNPQSDAGASNQSPQFISVAGGADTAKTKKGLWIGIGIAALAIVVCGGGSVGLYAAGLFSHRGRPPAAEQRPTQVVQIEIPATQTPVQLTATMPTDAPQTSEPSQTPASTATEAPTATQLPVATIPSPTIIPPRTPQKTDPIPPQEAPVRIAYVVGSVGNTDIYVADADGRNRVCVACRSCDEAEPAWSPDGQNIIYQSNCEGSYDIWQVGADGGLPKRLTQISHSDEREPDCSLGGHIAYRITPKDQNRNSDGELWVTNSDGGDSRSLGVQGRSPTWSPNGAWLTYMSERDGSWEIYMYDYTLSGAYQLTNCSTNCRWPTWSPDGRFIIYHATSAPGSVTADTIWSLEVESGNATRLVSGYAAGRPTWSVNGKIAFNSERGIEIVNEQGQNRQVLISNDNNWAPIWSK